MWEGTSMHQTELKLSSKDRRVLNECRSKGLRHAREVNRAHILAALQERVKEVWVTGEAVRPVGVEGAVVSGGTGVVTGKRADCAEALPAASRAATVKAYRVLAESPVIATDVPAGEATSAPSRYTR